MSVGFSSETHWHKRVWWLAVPIILSNITVPLVGAVDTAVTGHMDSPEPIAAVALGASVFSLVFWTFGFLKMGTSGSVAQAFGANDKTTIHLTIIRSLIIAACLGAVIVAFNKPLLDLALRIVGSDANIEQLTREYFSIRVWSAPATLANYVLIGVLIGLQRMRAVFAFQLVLNSINVILDIIFVPVLGYGIAGVATASLISEYAAFGFLLYLIREQLVVAFTTSNITSLRQAEPLKRLLKLNGDIFIRTLLLGSCFFYFNASSAKFDSTVFAANVILMQLLHICAYALDGFAHAAETMVGQALGSKTRGSKARGSKSLESKTRGSKKTQISKSCSDRSRQQFYGAVRASTIQALVTATTMSALLFVAAPAILRLFTNQIEVLNAAESLLPWLYVLPILSVWCYQLDGIFIGTTHSREMRNAMIISTPLFFGLTALLIPKLGNTGLWLAFSIFMVTRAVTLYCFYPRIRKAIDQGTDQATDPTTDEAVN